MQFSEKDIETIATYHLEQMANLIPHKDESDRAGHALQIIEVLKTRVAHTLPELGSYLHPQTPAPLRNFVIAFLKREIGVQKALKAIDDLDRGIRTYFEKNGIGYTEPSHLALWSAANDGGLHEGLAHILRDYCLNPAIEAEIICNQHQDSPLTVNLEGVLHAATAVTLPSHYRQLAAKIGNRNPTDEELQQTYWNTFFANAEKLGGSELYLPPEEVKLRHPLRAPEEQHRYQQSVEAMLPTKRQD